MSLNYGLLIKVKDEYRSERLVREPGGIIIEISIVEKSLTTRQLFPVYHSFHQIANYR